MTTNNSDRHSPGFWMNLFNSFRVAWRLMWDSRVPASAKLVPILTVLYILSPIDLVPDVIVGLGQLDDLAIFLLGTQALHRRVAERHRRAHPRRDRRPAAGWRLDCDRQPAR